MAQLTRMRSPKRVEEYLRKEPPLTPEEQVRLFERFSPEAHGELSVATEIRRVLASRRDLSPKVKELFVEREVSSYVMEAFVAARASLGDEETLFSLHLFRPQFRRTIARHAQDLPVLADLLARDPDPEVRKALVTVRGEEPLRLPPKAQRLLVKDPDKEVRKRLATGVSDLEAALLLAQDPEPSVRSALVLGNSPLLRYLLPKAASALPERVKMEATRRALWREKAGSKEELSRAMAQDPSPLVRRAVATFTESRELMESFLQDLPEVQDGLARNPSLPEDLQLLLVKKGEPRLLKALAENPNLTSRASAEMVLRYPLKLFFPGEAEVYHRFADNLCQEPEAGILFLRAPEVPDWAKAHLLSAPKAAPELLISVLENPSLFATPFLRRAYEGLATAKEDGRVDEVLVRHFPAYVGAWGGSPSYLAALHGLNPVLVPLLHQKGVGSRLFRREVPEGWMRTILDRPELLQDYAYNTQNPPPLWALEEMAERGCVYPILVLGRRFRLPPSVLPKLLSRLWERGAEVEVLYRALMAFSPLPDPLGPGIVLDTVRASLEGLLAGEREGLEVAYLLEALPDSAFHHLPSPLLAKAYFVLTQVFRSEPYREEVWKVLGRRAFRDRVESHTALEAIAL